MQPLYFQVHNPHSRLGCDLYEDSDSESDAGSQLPSTINEEDENDTDKDGLLTVVRTHDDENCSCCSSFDDTDDDDDDDDDGEDSTFSTSSKSSKNDVVNNKVRRIKYLVALVSRSLNEVHFKIVDRLLYDVTHVVLFAICRV